MKQLKNRIFERIRSGNHALGVNVQTASEEAVEIAGRAGYDYVMLDWEHGSYGFDRLVSLIRAAEAVDISSVVRIPHGDAVTVCRVLDAGAHGIVVPQISSVEQAREVMAAARFQSNTHEEGRRGACPSTRAAGHLCRDWTGFVTHANQDVFLALGFETVDAISMFDEMADAGRMDAVFIGAFDLAQSMGLNGQMHHPDVMAALEPLLQKAKARHIPIFATLVSADAEAARKDASAWVERGAGLINVVSDRRALYQGLSNRLDAIRPAQP
jgi:4-hydroxy-2-oxoheptanedioate aldolase